jgi:hypothetical protein
MLAQKFDQFRAQTSTRMRINVRVNRFVADVHVGVIWVHTLEFASNLGGLWRHDGMTA